MEEDCANIWLPLNKYMLFRLLSEPKPPLCTITPVTTTGLPEAVKLMAVNGMKAAPRATLVAAGVEGLSETFKPPPLDGIGLGVPGVVVQLGDNWPDMRAAITPV